MMRSDMGLKTLPTASQEETAAGFIAMAAAWMWLSGVPEWSMDIGNTMPWPTCLREMALSETHWPGHSSAASSHSWS